MSFAPVPMNWLTFLTSTDHPSTNSRYILYVCCSQTTDAVWRIWSQQRLLDTIPDHSLPDVFTSILRASFDEKLEVLDAVDLADRFKTAQPLLLRQIAVRGVKALDSVKI